METFKIINIYIATADDMEFEQKELMDLISHLNKILIKRNLNINVVKHNRNMGNISDCELCLTLFWTKFGDYSKEELEIAYQELQGGRNPRKLYVFFKNTDDINPDLREFKESFATTYGHFFCRFENVDTMRLNFLLQLEAYQNNLPHNRLLRVENQKILVERECVANLNNVPFTAMNKEYIRLRDGIEKLTKRIAKCRKQLAEDSDDEDSQEDLDDYLKEYKQMQEEFDLLQNRSLNTALKLARLSEDMLIDGLNRVVEEFNSGNMDKCNGMLDEILRRADTDFEDYKLSQAVTEQKLKKIIHYISALLVKCDTIFAKKNISIDSKINEIATTYAQAYKYAVGINYQDIDNVKYSELLDSYFSFLYKSAKYVQSNDICMELLDVYKKLLIKDSKYAYWLILRYCYISEINISLNRFEKSREFLSLATSLLNDMELKNSNDEAYYSGEVARIFCILEDYKSAMFYYGKAIDLYFKGYEYFRIVELCDKITAIYNYNDSALQLIQLNETFDKILRHYSLFKKSALTSDIYYNLGKINTLKGDHNEALNNFQSALNLIDKNRGEIGYEERDIYGGMVSIYLLLNKPKKMIEYSHKLLNCLKEKFTVDNYDLIIFNLTIGQAYQLQEDYDNTLYHYQEATKLQEIEYGFSHPETMYIYDILIGIYKKKSDYHNMLLLLKKSLSIAERVFGSNHYDVASYNYKIATVYTSLCDHKVALDYHLNALKTRENILGCENNDTVNSYKKVADTYYMLGDKDNALIYLVKYVDSRIKLNLYDAETALSCANVGIVSSDLYQKLQYNLKALGIREAIFGVEHTDTEQSYFNIGNVYIDLKDYDKALEYFNKALEVSVLLERENSYEAAGTYNSIGYIYNEIKAYDKALEKYIKSLSITLDLFGEEDLNTATNYYSIGKTYNLLGDYEMALKYLNRSLFIRIQELGEEDSRTILTKEQITIAKSKL